MDPYESAENAAAAAADGFLPEVRTETRLARKRATDRRAQRAARDRRQKYIESLLRQIESLSGLPHDRVDELFQANERLRAENELLRSKTIDILGHGSENIGVEAGSTGSSPLRVLQLQPHGEISRESPAATCHLPGT